MKLRLLKKSEIGAAARIVGENYNKEWEKSARREIAAMFVPSVVRPRYFVAEEHEELLGFAGYAQSWMDYDVYEIFWVNVRKDVQQRGIGRKLLTFVIADIRRQKKSGLILLSANKDKKLQEYYGRHFGFTTYAVSRGIDHIMGLEI